MAKLLYQCLRIHTSKKRKHNFDRDQQFPKRPDSFRNLCIISSALALVAISCMHEPFSRFFSDGVKSSRAKLSNICLRSVS